MHPQEIQSLVRAVGTANPHDSRAQTILLERINAMRELMRRSDQRDLAAYLEAAGLLTEALVHPSGSTPERIAGLVSRLVMLVESHFAGAPAALPANAAPQGEVCLAPELAGSEELDLDLKMVHDKPIGEILVSHGRVTRDQVDEALRGQRATGMRLGEVLVMMGAVTWDDISEAVRLQGKMRDSALAADDSEA